MYHSQLNGPPTNRNCSECGDAAPKEVLVRLELCSCCGAVSFNSVRKRVPEDLALLMQQQNAKLARLNQELERRLSPVDKHPQAVNQVLFIVSVMVTLLTAYLLFSK